MKSEMIRLLRESSEYLSGQELCDRFQVSRTAVWKVINQLKEEGYVIEAVQNKGYYLVSAPDLVTKEEISSRLKTAWAGHPTVFLPNEPHGYRVGGTESLLQKGDRFHQHRLQAACCAGRASRDVGGSGETGERKRQAWQRLGVAGGRVHLYVSSVQT